MAANNKVILRDMENRSEDITFYGAYSNEVYRELLDIKRMNRMIDYAAMAKYDDQSIKCIYSEAYVTDEEGRIVTCKDRQMIGSICPLLTEMDGGDGEAFPGGFVLKSVLETCDWNVIARISMFSLMKNYIKYFFLILLATCLICGAALIICTKIARHLNDTLYDLQSQMNMVAEGKMESADFIIMRGKRQ